MTRLLLLIGLPGSGKSTLGKQLLTECPRRQLIYSNAIRGQLFGDEAIQGVWMLVWREIQRQFQQAVATGNALPQPESTEIALILTATTPLDF